MLSTGRCSRTMEGIIAAFGGVAEACFCREPILGLVSPLPPVVYMLAAIALAALPLMHGRTTYSVPKHMTLLVVACLVILGAYSYLVRPAEHECNVVVQQVVSDVKAWLRARPSVLGLGCSSPADTWFGAMCEASAVRINSLGTGSDVLALLAVWVVYQAHDYMPLLSGIVFVLPVISFSVMSTLIDFVSIHETSIHFGSLASDLLLQLLTALFHLELVSVAGCCALLWQLISGERVSESAAVEPFLSQTHAALVLVGTLGVALFHVSTCVSDAASYGWSVAVSMRIWRSAILMAVGWIFHVPIAHPAFLAFSFFLASAPLWTLPAPPPSACNNASWVQRLFYKQRQVEGERGALTRLKSLGALSLILLCVLSALAATSMAAERYAADSLLRQIDLLPPFAAPGGSLSLQPECVVLPDSALLYLSDGSLSAAGTAQAALTLLRQVWYRPFAPSGSQRAVWTASTLAQSFARVVTATTCSAYALGLTSVRCCMELAQLAVSAVLTLVGTQDHTLFTSASGFGSAGAGPLSLWQPLLEYLPWSALRTLLLVVGCYLVFVGPPVVGLVLHCVRRCSRRPAASNGTKSESDGDSFFAMLPIGPALFLTAAGVGLSGMVLMVGLSQSHQSSLYQEHVAGFFPSAFYALCFNVLISFLVPRGALPALVAAGVEYAHSLTGAILVYGSFVLPNGPVAVVPFHGGSVVCPSMAPMDALSPTSEAALLLGLALLGATWKLVAPQSDTTPLLLPPLFSYPPTTTSTPTLSHEHTFNRGMTRARAGSIGAQQRYDFTAPIDTTPHTTTGAGSSHHHQGVGATSYANDASLAPSRAPPSTQRPASTHRQRVEPPTFEQQPQPSRMNVGGDGGSHRAPASRPPQPAASNAWASSQNASQTASTPSFNGGVGYGAAVPPPAGWSRGYAPQGASTAAFSSPSTWSSMASSGSAYDTSGQWGTPSVAASKQWQGGSGFAGRTAHGSGGSRSGGGGGYGGSASGGGSAIGGGSSVGWGRSAPHLSAPVGVREREPDSDEDDERGDSGATNVYTIGSMSAAPVPWGHMLPAAATATATATSQFAHAADPVFAQSNQRNPELAHASSAAWPQHWPVPTAARTGTASNSNTSEVGEGATGSESWPAASPTHTAAISGQMRHRAADQSSSQTATGTATTGSVGRPTPSRLGFGDDGVHRFGVQPGWRAAVQAPLHNPDDFADSGEGGLHSHYSTDVYGQQAPDVSSQTAGEATATWPYTGGFKLSLQQPTAPSADDTADADGVHEQVWKRLRV